LLKTVQSKLKYPVIVKPAHLGSSIGIAVAKDEEELKTALSQAFTLDCRVVVEKFLKRKSDVNCAAYLLGGEICVSEVEEAASGEGVYSFEEKYLRADGGLMNGDLRKDRGRVALNGELREKIRGYTKTLYKRMDICGVVRMDYLVSDGKAYLSEVNTVPGSLAYYLFCERISDGKRFLSDLIEEAFLQFEAEKKKVVSTGILRSGIADEWRK
jgi:D-alanine-D-alanine ligase